VPDTLGRITGPLARRLGPDVPLAPDRPLSTFHKGLYGFVSRTIPAEFPHLWGAPKELSHLFSVASSVRTGLSTLGTEPPALDFSPSAADGSGMPGLVPDYVWMAMPFVVAAGAALHGAADPLLLTRLDGDVVARDPGALECGLVDRVLGGERPGVRRGRAGRPV